MTTDLAVVARADCAALVTALMLRDHEALVAALDGCESPLPVALHETAILVHDSFRAVVSVASGRVASPDDCAKALHDMMKLPSEPGMELPGHVYDWLCDADRGVLWPPASDHVLHLAAALWLCADLWEHAALPGAWADFLQFRRELGGSGSV